MAMDASHIEFIIGATYDVLPTQQNLSQWVGEDRGCKLCLGCWLIKTYFVMNLVTTIIDQ